MRLLIRSLALAALVAASGCVTPTQAPASGCIAEQALYRIRGADATLRFVQTPHPLNAYSELAVRVDYEGETYWFSYSASMGFSRHYIGQTEDPFEAAAREEAETADSEPPAPAAESDSNELVLFDANYDVIEALPQKGGPAPAHVVATGISSDIWYSLPRRVLPKAMWDFSACVDDLG